MRIAILIVMGMVLIGTSVLIARGGLRRERELAQERERPLIVQPAPAVAPPSCPPAVAAEAPDTLALQDAIRQIVREELRAARVGAETEARQAGGAHAAPLLPPTTESIEALRQTRGVVLGALSTRYWGSEQATAMSELLPRLTTEQRAEVFKELLPALNSGDIVVATEGSPF